MGSLGTACSLDVEPRGFPAEAPDTAYLYNARRTRFTGDRFLNTH